MDTWQTAVLIAIILCLIYIGAWIWNFLKWRKAKYSTAKRPADGTDYITYDSTGSIKAHRKQMRRELHESMKGRRGKRNETVQLHKRGTE